MATGISPPESVGQGLFGIQLEVTAKLLDAEKKKLAQIELQLQHDSTVEISLEKTKELDRQKANYVRLSLQHSQLTKEYEEAARGVLRRSTKQRKSSRSHPSIGLKQTVKARSSIFGTIVQGNQHEKVSRIDQQNNSTPGEHRSQPCRIPNNNFSESVVFEDGHLISGSLEGLIGRLIPTTNYYPDRTYIFAFLLCSRLFILRHDLMSRVSKGCADQIKKETKESALTIARNLIQLISEWTEAFPNDFRDEVMMMHLRDITNYCASLSTDIRKTVGQLTQSLFKKLALLDKYEEVLAKATAVAEDRRRTGSGPYKSVLEVCPNAVVLAQQLSHIELERLANIGPEEYVQTFIPRDEADLKSTLSYIKRTSGLEAYIEWFNRLSYLVATEICLGVKTKHRAKLIGYFADVASECYRRGNFNSSMAIIAGINTSPVARLKKTWSKVKSKNFERLERELNPGSNFASYRAAFKSASSKYEFVVPFFSLFIKDVYFLNEGYNNRLPNGQINFEKFWQLSKLITEFMSWKEADCTYDRYPAVLNYLMTVPVFSENSLALASYDCESPETAFEKERHKSLKRG